MHGLSDNIEVRVVGAPIAAGSSIDGNSSRIDMADYESVQFVAPITDTLWSPADTSGEPSTIELVVIRRSPRSRCWASPGGAGSRL